jgi:hypothetical protein
MFAVTFRQSGRGQACSPSGTLDPPWLVDQFTPVTVTFDGATCQWRGPSTFRANDVIRVSFINATSADALAVIGVGPEAGVAVQVPARGNATNTGYAELSAKAPHQVSCFAGAAPGAHEVRGPTLSTTDS